MSANEIQEVVITGFGGQGIILAGVILGKAASLYDQKKATLIQSYGPEARGGACSAEVVIAHKDILYPYVHSPLVLVCLSQEGFDKSISSLRPQGVVLWDSDLVTTEGRDKRFQSFSIPATRFAEEMGNKMMANIIMLGFLTAIWAQVSPPSMEKAITSTVPKGSEAPNLKAFRRGLDFGKTVLLGAKQKSRKPVDEEDKRSRT